MSEMNLNRKVEKDAVLAISIDRVEKIPAPLLVIGLGGTGVDILKQVKSFFAERFVLPKNKDGQTIPVPPYTAYLGIDTDKSAQGLLSDHEFLNITLTGMASILEPSVRESNLSADERAWVHKNLTADAAGAGAGGMRQAARFMLNRAYVTVRDAISSALREITRVEAGSGVDLGRIEIAICTGICGGTGSGTFLDIPQIVRYCIRQEPALAGKDIRITGYIVMPDVSLSVSTDATMKKKLEANGYAALKELDFWMRVDKHKTPYTMKFPNGDAITWDRAPYDACILLSGVSVKHAAFNNPKTVVQQLVAENLLHYMAREKPNANGEEMFTYMSHENNMKGFVEVMKKPLPLGYCYRAIGAYSKKLPKQRMLSYETQLLFKDFMPLRDDYGKLVPDASMLEDGRTMDRSAKIRGDMKVQMQNFCAKAPLPPWCGYDADNDNEMTNLRSANIKPHDRRDHANYGMWQTRVINPQINKFGEMYFEECWETFKKFCESVMQDVKKGPFALLHYLEHEKGLLMQMKKDVDSISAAAANGAGAMQAAYNNCKTAWPEFERPPLLGRKRATETYLTNMKNYFMTIRQAAFRTEVASQQRRLLKRIEEYIRDALKPMCADLEAMEVEFAAVRAENAEMSEELFDVALLTDRMDAQFEQENADNKVTKLFLGNMIGLTFETERNVDASTSGVRFLYNARSEKGKYEVLRDLLSECFGQMNNQSLDHLMDIIVGEKLEDRQRYMNEMFKSIRGSSMPMFAMDGAVARSFVPYSYMAVPDDSPEHVEHFQSIDRASVTIKGSALRDHIYCVTAYDGLTLSSYSQMSVMQQSYEELMHLPGVALGLHLVWTGEYEGDYTRNWTRLPSPKPAQYFVGAGSAASEVEYFEKACNTVNRAIASGMLKVDATKEQPVMHVSNFYTDRSRITMLPSYTIKKNVDAIMAASKNPRTGEPVTNDDKLKQLEEMKSNMAATVVETHQSPLVLDVYCHVNNLDINPWDPDVRANAIRLAEAEERYEQLSRVLAAGVLVDRPELLRTVEEQLEGLEYLTAAINKIQKMANAWQPRHDYAETFADLWVIGEIFAGMNSVRYKSASGKKQGLVDEDLLAEDLKDVSQLVQGCCFLADTSEENPVRYQLEKNLKKFNKTMEEDEDAFEAEDLQIFLENAEELVQKAEDELNELQDALTAKGADTEFIRKQIELLEGIAKQAKSRVRYYKRALR